MAIDLEKIGFTKRTWILLGVLVLLLVGYYVSGASDPPQAKPVAVGTPPGSAAVQRSVPTVSQGAPVAVPAGPVVAAARDPFEVPAMYRQPESSGISEKASVRAAGTGAEAGASAPAVPQLYGTMASGNAKAAMLALGGESRPVRIGGRLGAFTVMDVGAGWAVLDGPGGQLTLRVGRQ